MKKIAGTLIALSMFAGTAAADSIRIDPLMLASGGIGVSYQYNLDKESAIVLDHASYKQTIFSSEISLGLTTVTYKKPFSGNNLDQGAYWRAGGGSITTAVGSLGVSGFGPAAAVGYDHKFNNEWSIQGEFGIGSLSFVRVGYSF